MSYIGQRPVVGRYIKLDQISSGFNGSNTGFSMTAGSQAVFPGTARNLLLSLGGVIQEPDTDFTISGSTLTFTTPPVANTTFFGVIYGDMQATGTPSDGTVLPASIASSGNFSFPEVTVTGDVNIADSIIHSGDTDTKIRFPVANQISFETTGSEAVRIDESGRLGIGHDNPSQLLTVRGNAPIIRIEENQSGGSKRLDLGVTNSGAVGYIGANQSASSLAFQTTNNERMRITSAGLVGIGTTSPTTSLHVQQSAVTSAPSRSSALYLENNANCEIQFVGNSSNDCQLRFGTSSNSFLGAIEYELDNANMEFYTGGSERLRIDSSGNVGIGTTSPHANLHIQGGNSSSSPAEINVWGGTLGRSKFNLVATETGTTTGTFQLTTESTVPPSAELVTITNAGNVGIGTTSPSNLLHVRQEINATGSGTAILQIENTRINTGTGAAALAFRTNEITSGASYLRAQIAAEYDGASNVSGRLLFHTVNSSGSFQEVMRLDDSGNVGIGTTSPAVKLDVTGKIHASTSIGIRTTSPQCNLHVHQGDSGSVFAKFTNSTTTIGSSNGFDVGLNSSEQGFLHVRENKPLLFQINGSERMRIDSSGHVGIGTTTPGDNTVKVQLSDSNSDSVVVLGGSGQGRTNINVRAGNASSGSITAFRLQNSSATAIGSFHMDNSTDDINLFNGSQGGKIFFHTNESGSSLVKMTITDTGRLGIGTTSPESVVHFKHATQNALLRLESGDEYVHILFKDSTTTNLPYIGAQGNNLRVITGGSERFRIEDDNEGTGFGGATLVTYNNMATHSGTGSEGARIRNDGAAVFGTSNNVVLKINRRSTDGALIEFLQNGSSEGSIAVSGSTVSYNGGHLSRWSQLKGVSTTDKSARPTIYQGTVMSNLDDLCSWSHAEVLYDEDVLYTLEDTLPEGKSVGDVKIAKGTVRKEAYTEENQQLNMTKISDTEGDKDVAGVFWTWDDEDDEIVNDFFVAMTGDMVIRVAASTTVARGDLLISAGDGTAKPQADDIIRSSTIAKIISTNPTATYADGSKAYPCVLMAC